jgi:hypothetical protein
VFAGRPNRLYCTDECQKQAQNRRAHQRRKGTEKVSTFTGPVRSVIPTRSNGVLIAEIAKLGYLGGPNDTVLDVTYGRGLWWTKYQPAWLIAGEGDFRLRPEGNNTVKVVCFDPPYISTGNRGTSTTDAFYARYGLGEIQGGWRNVRKLIDDGLAECARILTPGGYLLVKCMDYVEGGRKIWNTFHVAAHADELGLQLLDRFIHLTGGGPLNTTNLDGSPRAQQRAREVASMLLVFTK